MGSSEDLNELAEELGGTASKISRLLELGASGWVRGQPITDRQILTLAMQLGKGRHLQWKSMLLELNYPKRELPEKAVPKGTVSLTPHLTTDFHNELVTSEWIAGLEDFLSTHPILTGLGGHGHVAPAYNHDRYMGPQSVVKYRFVVGIVVRRPNSPLKWRVSYSLEYRPKTDGFKMFPFSLTFSWRLGLLQETLSRMGSVSERQFAKAAAESEGRSRVKRLLGLASPVRCLLELGHLREEDLIELLIQDCGILQVEEGRMTAAQPLWREDATQAYQALRIDEEPIPVVVLAHPITLEEYEYVQYGSGGALPAFTTPGCVFKMLRSQSSAAQRAKPESLTTSFRNSMTRIRDRGKSGPQ